MITNNFFNLLGYIRANAPAWVPSGGGVALYADIGLKNTSGNAISFQYASYNDNLELQLTLKNWRPWANLSAKVGTGTTEPAATDYNIENDASSNISGLTTTFNINAGNNAATLTLSISGINNSAAPLTLTEVCIFKDINIASGATCMILREMLPNPLIVPAGSGFTITLTWAEGQEVEA